MRDDKEKDPTTWGEEEDEALWAMINRVAVMIAVVVATFAIFAGIILFKERMKKAEKDPAETCITIKTNNNERFL